MSADTETIREAVAKIERVLTTHWLTSVRGDEVHTAAFEAVGSIRAALGRVEERYAELVRRSEALEDSIVRNGGRLLNEHTWNAWVTEVARARAALASSVAGEQETEYVKYGAGTESEGSSHSVSRKDPASGSVAAGSGEE